jgi:hypothetical protein
METPEECRRAAADLEQTAGLISLRTDREKLLEMARQWRELAADLEAKAQAPPSSEDGG